MTQRSPKTKSSPRWGGVIRHGYEAFAWRTKPTSNTFACFTMIHRMTTISWTGSPPTPTMSARERLSRWNARLSICDVLDRHCDNGAGPLLVQCEQGAIIAHVMGIQNRHGPIIQN